MEDHINNVGKSPPRGKDIMNVHPKLVTLLGRSSSTSYGQHVLQHVGGRPPVAVMAAELKLDQRLARRCGVSTTSARPSTGVRGLAPVIGGELLKRFEEAKEVVDAAANHHNDADANFVYTVLASAADADLGPRGPARGASP